MVLLVYVFYLVGEMLSLYVNGILKQTRLVNKPEIQHNLCFTMSC